METTDRRLGGSGLCIDNSGHGPRYSVEAMSGRSQSNSEATVGDERFDDHSRVGFDAAGPAREAPG